MRKAILADVPGISRVCSAGYRATYPGLLTDDEIEATIAEWYSLDRIYQDVVHPEGWNGWWVALDDQTVVGAGGGAFIAPASSELYVLYIDSQRRGEGFGTALLDAITDELYQQGAREQWVAVTPNNQKGIPFYEARGFVVRGTRPAYGNTFQEGRQSLLYWRALLSEQAAPHTTCIVAG
jgi:ribosomal protein S18 acetylase RimI-like enzyme